MDGGKDRTDSRDERRQHAEELDSIVHTTQTPQAMPPPTSSAATHQSDRQRQTCAQCQ
jgi:hypothetical protein